MISEEENNAHERLRALSDVLDGLEKATHDESIAVQEVIEELGHKSFASVMLIFSLISTSPASAIPGVTAMVAAIVFILVIQMILGRRCVWLPAFITRRQLSTAKLCKGIRWLRKPIHVIEGFLKPRLTFLFHRPWIYIPLVLVLGLTLFMPFMEIVPTSGSIASAVIAFFAAGLLTRDGALVLASLILFTSISIAAWQFGFAP